MSKNVLKYGKLTVSFLGSNKFSVLSYYNLKKQLDWVSKDYFSGLLYENVEIVFNETGDTYVNGHIFYIRINKYTEANASLIFAILSIKYDFTVIHATCLVKDNESYVFAAHGGVGKTALLLSAEKLNNGFHFAGDDLVIIKDDLTIFPVLRPLCIYLYHYKLFKSSIEEKVYFVYPSILVRIVRKFLIEYFKIDWFGNKILSRIVPYSDYYIKSAKHFSKPLLNKKIKVTRLNYLEKDTVYKKNNIPTNQILPLIVESTIKEFSFAQEILETLSNDIQKENWINIINRKIRLIQKQLNGPSFVIRTNGVWCENQIYDAIKG